MDMPNRIIHLRSLRKSPFGPAGLRAGFLLSEFRLADGGIRRTGRSRSRFGRCVLSRRSPNGLALTLMKHFQIEGAFWDATRGFDRLQPKNIIDSEHLE